MATQYTYFFGNKSAEGDGSQKDLLGGKGANLHEMTKLGLPVPHTIMPTAGSTRQNWTAR